MKPSPAVVCLSQAAAERRRRVCYGPIARMHLELGRTPPATADLDAMNAVDLGRMLDRLEDEVNQRRESSPLFSGDTHEDEI